MDEEEDSQETETEAFSTERCGRQFSYLRSERKPTDNENEQTMKAKQVDARV